MAKRKKRGKAAAVAKPSREARFPPRLLRLLVLGLMIVFTAAWAAAHFAVDWSSLKLFPVGVAVFSSAYGLYRFTETTTQASDSKLRKPIREILDRITRRVLILAAVLVLIPMVLISTLSLRGLASGTRITVPPFAGEGTREKVAVDKEPLQLHFFLPFRSIDIISSDHAKTTRRTWPVLPRRVDTAHLTPYAAVLVRLPGGAQRFLDSGKFVIGGKTYDGNSTAGAVLVGEYPAARLQDPEKRWTFPPELDGAAQPRAVAVWSRPIIVKSAPAAQPFRVSYVVNSNEVAAVDGVTVPAAGLTEIDMKWTWGKTKS